MGNSVNRPSIIVQYKHQREVKIIKVGITSGILKTKTICKISLKYIDFINIMGEWKLINIEIIPFILAVIYRKHT